MRAALLFTLALGLAGPLGAAVSQASDWPQFRGPSGTSLTAETKLPTQWGPGMNVLWKVKLPGTGWSSPIVGGDKLIVTTAVTATQPKPRLFQFGGGPGGGGVARRPP